MKAAFLLLYKGYKMKLKSKINRSYKAIRNNPYVKVLVDSVRDFLDNESMNFAAATAFYTIFSLPAFVMIVLRIGSAFYNESEVKSELFTHVETSMGSEARKTLEDILENFAFVEEDQIAAFIVIGIILFSATTVFISLQNGINHIWHIKPKKEKGFLQLILNRLLSFSIVASFGFILIVSLLLETVLAIVFGYFDFILDEFNLRTASIVQFVVSQIVLFILFTIMYRVLPDAKVHWKDTLYGSLITTLLFILGKYGIGLYLANSELGSTYGAAGSLVIILLWVYYSVVIFLFGGQITYYIAENLGRGITPNKFARKVFLRDEDEC